MASLVTINKPQEPKSHTTSPLMVGASVICIPYNQGILLASDTMISYGSLHYKKNHTRFEKLSDKIVFVGSGEYSDFQELHRMMMAAEKAQRMHNDDIQYSIKEYANYLARLCYQRRNKANPYLGQFIIAGQNSDGTFQQAKVDMFGNISTEQIQLTGMAELMAIPLIHNYWNPQVDYQKAKDIMAESFRVLFSRHARTTDKQSNLFISPYYHYIIESNFATFLSKESTLNQVYIWEQSGITV